MNILADRLFSLLLGWTRSLFNGLWNLFTNSSEGIIAFLRQFWLPIIAVLLIFGTLADYTVWFIRWRPHYVWRSWFRRHESKRRLNTTRHYMENLDHSPLDLPEFRDAPAYDEIPMQDEPVFFNFSPIGATSPEEDAQALPFVSAQPTQEKQQPYVLSLPWDQDRQSAPEEAGSPKTVYPNLEGQEFQPQTPYQPLYTSEAFNTWNDAAEADTGSHASVPPTKPAPRQRRAGSRRQRRPGLLTAIRSTLFESEDESLTLDSLPPPVPREEAFHEPYYPQNYSYRTTPVPTEQQDPDHQ